MPMAGCHKSRGKYIVTGDLFRNEKLKHEQYNAKRILRTPLSKITSTGEIEQRFRLN